MQNNLPKIIDLYSGVGGLSLGAAKAGFDVICAVEREKRILESHSKNFPLVKHLNEDVSLLTRASLGNFSKLKSELAGLIGGPPCQGFSTMGKRNIDDARNDLFIDFFRLVNEMNPVFFLAENVPGILNSKYDEIRKKALFLVESKYTVLRPLQIVASDFGAVTSRTRVFFIGIRNDIKGGDDIMNAIESQKNSDLFCVRDALVGLPQKISESWLDYESSWQKITKTDNSYVLHLNELIDGIGDTKSLNRFLKKDEVSGCFGTKHSRQVASRYDCLLPGQQDMVSKSIRLKETGLCPTLRAGTDKTKGSFQAVRPIHPVEPRVITPREAARLQGFPDWFQFHETKWHSFRQIGNSVCPIAAQKVLTAIKLSINI